MWWHPERVYRLRWSTSSISVFPFTACFAGRHRSFVSLRCTCMSVPRRPWRRLDMEAIRAGLRSSSLCSADIWSRLDIDGLARLYDTEITAVLNGLMPVATVTYIRRPSLIRGSTTSVPRRSGESAGWNVPLDKTIRLLMGLSTRNNMLLVAVTGLYCVESERSFGEPRSTLSSTPRPAVEVYRRADGPRVAFEPSTSGPTDFHQFFDAKVAGVRGVHRRCPVADVHSGRPRMQFHSF